MKVQFLYMCDLGFWEYATQNEGFVFQQTLQLLSELMKTNAMFANMRENLQHSKTSAAKT
jgi:hypothetical protein